MPDIHICDDPSHEHNDLATYLLPWIVDDNIAGDIVDNIVDAIADYLFVTGDLHNLRDAVIRAVLVRADDQRGDDDDDQGQQHAADSLRAADFVARARTDIARAFDAAGRGLEAFAAALAGDPGNEVT